MSESSDIEGRILTSGFKEMVSTTRLHGPEYSKTVSITASPPKAVFQWSLSNVDKSDRFGTSKVCLNAVLWVTFHGCIVDTVNIRIFSSSYMSDAVGLRRTSEFDELGNWFIRDRMDMSITLSPGLPVEVK